MIEKPNVLVVCGRNKRRSRTAEYIFKNDSRFNIRSVGLSEKSERRITERDLLWADIILAMEDKQKVWISRLYRHLDLPRIELLEISDDFAYLDSELIELITERINDILLIIYKI